MIKRYGAVDIGASSGRMVLGWIENEHMKMEEIHRFKNGISEKDEHCYWDIDHLYEEVIHACSKAAEHDANIRSIGIDTWGVDYVLVDDLGERCAPVFSYRDHRTDHTMEKVFSLLPKDQIYAKTGIQFMQFNSLFQLYEHQKARPEDFTLAKHWMMIPDYLHFRLTKKPTVEFTNATTSHMLNTESRTWDAELLEVIGVQRDIFPEPIQPGTLIGPLLKELQEKTGLQGVNIVAPATHDTGSAIVATPTTDENYAYISSGTWSLMGIESKEAITSEAAFSYNFTNEGGVFGTYRVLKNIMGLWMIQEVKRLYNDAYDFAELVVLAQESEPFASLVNPVADRFLNPVNMIEEIQAFCRETKQKVPMTPGEVARCIYESLAFQYRKTLEEIREISGRELNRIHIIGGGCKNEFLNRLTANLTACEVFAGPVEATAIGNLAMQMITEGEISGLEEARAMIKASFDISHYQPEAVENMEEVWKRFLSLT